MDRRRAELQLRLVQATLRAERKRGDSRSLERFLNAAFPIVNKVALDIGEARDDDLSDLLASVRSDLRSAGKAAG
jgi:hypothetical protein